MVRRQTQSRTWRQRGPWGSSSSSTSERVPEAAEARARCPERPRSTRSAVHTTPIQHGTDRRQYVHSFRAARPPEHRPAGERDRGEDHHHQRRDQQVAVDDRQAGERRRATNVTERRRRAARAARASAAASATPRARRRRSRRAATGSLTSDLRKSTVAPGTSREAPVAAELLREAARVVSEKSGSPVTIRSVAIQISGAAATSSALRDALAATSRAGTRPEPVEAAEQPCLGPQQPGERGAGPAPASPRRGRSASRTRGPDDERQVRDVDVAARGEEREVEARAEERRRDEPDERRERRPRPSR